MDKLHEAVSSIFAAVGGVLLVVGAAVSNENITSAGIVSIFIGGVWYFFTQGD